MGAVIHIKQYPLRNGIAMRLRDGVQRPNTILQMSSSVWSYAQNGASMQCVQGRGLQGHVAFVYNFCSHICTS